MKMFSTRIVSLSPSNSLALQNLLSSRLSSAATSSIASLINSNNFVPKYQDANDEEVKELSEFVNSSKNLLAITGDLKIRIKCAPSV